MNKPALDLTSRLETLAHENVKDRSWSYITLGYGHGEQWWREFCYRLRLNGYDGWLSIEHEDIVLSRIEGMRKSVDLLKGDDDRREKRLRDAGPARWLTSVSIVAQSTHAAFNRPSK